LFAHKSRDGGAIKRINWANYACSGGKTSEARVVNKDLIVFNQLVMFKS
jgi:hypothetical protein